MKIRGLARLAVVAACLVTTGLPAPSAQAADQKPAEQKAVEQKAGAVKKTTVKKAPAKGKTAKTPAAMVVSRPGGPQYESIVVDAETGKVLHEANADVASPPASLTKMMTLYLLFDALKMSFRELKLRKDPACPICGPNRSARRAELPCVPSTAPP